MYLSHKLLSVSVDLQDQDPHTLAQKMMERIAETGGVIEDGKHLERVKVGKILSIAPHENAEKLQVTQTQVGDDVFQIVCGAKNIYEGMIVPVAVIGADLGEGFVITKAKLRGVESCGMLCSQKELRIGDSHEGIWDLSSIGITEENSGQSLQTLLGKDDILYDIDNKAVTNRPDRFGHIFFAKEIAALLGKPNVEIASPELTNAVSPVSFVNECGAPWCSSYALARANIEHIKNNPEHQHRLQALDMSCVHPVVDALNYTMLQHAQPLHAFDADQIDGMIHIRFAKKGETLLALNKNVLELETTDIVIADDSKVLALAGIIGGVVGSIQPTTKNILVECATFDAGTIRRTAKRLKLRTDASLRYEKTLVPAMSTYGIQRAVETLESLGAAFATHIEHAGDIETTRIIELSYKKVCDIAGYAIDIQIITNILEKLGATIQQTKNETFDVTVPFFRLKDWKNDMDLIEDILSLAGYETIPAKAPTLFKTPKQDSFWKMKWACTNILVQAGFQECETSSLGNPKQLAAVGYNDCIRIKNPLSDLYSVLSPSAFPQLLQACADHQKENDSLLFFEIRKHIVRQPDGTLWNTDLEAPTETMDINLVCSLKQKEPSVIQLRENVIHMLTMLGLQESLIRFDQNGTQTTNPLAHPGQSADIVYQGTKLGSLFTLHPGRAGAIGLIDTHQTSCAHIDMQALESMIPTQSTYTPLSRFPKSSLDISFIIDETTAIQTVVETLMEHTIENCQNIIVFDVYRHPEHVGIQKKAIGLRCILQRNDRTLEESEIQSALQSLIAAGEKQNWTLRM